MSKLMRTGYGAAIAAAALSLGLADMFDGPMPRRRHKPEDEKPYLDPTKGYRGRSRVLRNKQKRKKGKK